MPRGSNRIGLAFALLGGVLLANGLALYRAAELTLAVSDATTITNLAQLTHALIPVERLTCAVRLEVVVCASSRPALGVLVVQDSTGVELLEVGHQSQNFVPGEMIQIEGNPVLLRRREL